MTFQNKPLPGSFSIIFLKPVNCMKKLLKRGSTIWRKKQKGSKSLHNPTSIILMQPVSTPVPLKTKEKIKKTPLKNSVKAVALKGFIIDEEGEAIPEVVVSLMEYNQDAITDGAGRFQFIVDGEVNTPVTLGAKKEGYQNYQGYSRLGSTSTSFIMRKLHNSTD